MSELSELIGKVMVSVEKVEDSGGDRLVFTTDKGEVYQLFHAQDCCESVRIEDITGDLAMLVGHPILVAEESSSNEPLAGTSESQSDSFTWTFYKFGTVMGWVDVRWYGESNGYYSEGVDFVQTSEANPELVKKLEKSKAARKKSSTATLDSIVDKLMED